MNSRIKGSTKLYGVIGDPIAHSLSPEIHNSIFDKMQSNNIYIPLHIKPENLKASISLLKNSFMGFNVTIPHKQTIMEFLDEIEEQAAFYGAVNTVKVSQGKLIGYNTDGYGFMKSLELEKIDLEGKEILLVGAGGAARVVAHKILESGAFLTIANRNINRAKELQGELGAKNVDVCHIDEIESSYFGVVNATPVGMGSFIGELPMPERAFKDAAFVFDMIYNPRETKLLQRAGEYGCKCINGFAMLFYQAVRAQEIWMDKALPQNIMGVVFEEIKNYFYGE